MAGVITIELNDGSSMEKADKLIKTMLNALTHEQIQTVIACNYQEVVMSVEIPISEKDKDDFDLEDFGV